MTRSARGNRSICSTAPCMKRAMKFLACVAAAAFIESLARTILAPARSAARSMPPQPLNSEIVSLNLARPPQRPDSAQALEADLLPRDGRRHGRDRSQACAGHAAELDRSMARRASVAQ